MFKFLMLFLVMAFAYAADAGTYIKGLGSASFLVEEYTSTATAAGTTTLTATSNSKQLFTGTSNQTVVLPAATTLPLYRHFSIRNQSTGFLIVQDGSANEISLVAAGNTVDLEVTNIGTTAGTWAVSQPKVFSGQAALTFGMSRNTTTETAGNDLTLKSGSATNNSTNKNGGKLILSGGTSTGTGTSSIEFRTATAGGSGTSDVTPTSKMTLSGAGVLTLSAYTTAGVLKNDGSGVLSTINGTATGAFLRADGTTFAASTLTIPDSTTAPCALVTNTSSVTTCLAATTTNRLMRTNGTTIAFSQADLTTDVTGVLPIANGGTNSTATATAGGIGYGTGTAHAYSSAGTSGQMVLSGGTGSPTFENYTGGGTWSPTIPAATNTDAQSITDAYYFRTKDLVYFGVVLAVDVTTSAAAGTIAITLPVSSNFTTASDAAGTCGTTSGGDPITHSAVQADGTNDRLTWSWKITGTSNSTYYCHGVYRIK